MNNKHSEQASYYERWLTPLLQTASTEHPVIVLTGARQVGKSTLLRHAEPFRSWRYHTMDDFDSLRQATEDPQSLWAGTDALVLDEVQKAPKLIAAVKKAVDERQPPMHFVLSGSAHLLLMQQVSESLAGRAVYFILNPMTLGEIHGQPPPVLLTAALAGQWPAEADLAQSLPDTTPLLLRGFLPRLLTLERAEAWPQWWEGYVATYLERDLRQVAQIDALVDFRRLMELLALRTGQLVNQSDLGRDARLSQSTVHRYLNLLETTHLFDRLPAYTASHTTRLLKAPKAFWTDPGLAVFLAGYFDQESLRNSRELGSYFETMIYLHLRVLTSLLIPRARLYFWRTQTGDEPDIVVEHGRRLLAIEIKMTDNPGYRHVDGLRKFLQAHPHATGGLLIHCGATIKRLDEKIVAVPWSALTG
ncbi:MAG: ATP-binding protein [Chloroflexi bacterium]|nr:ATP-binding protein [Chloroflexota bacterium]